MYADAELPYNFYSQHVAGEAFRLVQQNRESIVDRFYRRLIKNAHASGFLSHQEIEIRLKGSFRDWLDCTFDRGRVLTDPKRFRDYQDNIGRVHSRVDISLHLINYAKVVLKSQ